MRRQLSLEDFRPGHPFRATVYPVTPSVKLPRQDDGDVKLFVLSFTAFFICIYTLLL